MRIQTLRAPLVHAFGNDNERAAPWENPVTHASGLRVPAPFGDRWVLRVLRESEGGAFSAEEEEIRTGTYRLASATGVDAAPEGGCALVVAKKMVRSGLVKPEAEIVVFNTGSGASYRW